MGKRNKGVPDVLPTNSSESIGSASPLSRRNNDRVAPVSGAQPRATAFARGVMGPPESLGARLSISPSMKIPANAQEAAATQANGRTVPSSGMGRNNGQFFGQGWRV